MTTGIAPTESRPQRGVLCIGEALVDLICERAVADLAEAPAFVPHFGGAVANVALLAARAGSQVALAGAAGDDAWGVWLRDRLGRAGVELDRFKPLPGSATRVALTIVDATGEPTYTVYGEPGGRVAAALDGELDGAVAGTAGLFLTTNTLVSGDERELTMRARELALQNGKPVVFDPNIRMRRWSSRADAAAPANACVPDALLVCANLFEARLMSGEEDVERAALALLKGGARNVVITLGPRGAILRGKLRLDVPALPAQVLSTIGAGDALTAALLARLECSDWYEPAIAAGLRDAVAAAAHACERWGAVD